MPSLNITANVPDTVPLFPLSGVLLLPHCTMPLHIFEPRYVAMLEDAMAGDGVIGMIQPVSTREDEDEPELYDTGCIGRIIEDEETDDGRRMISLAGLTRFDLIDELPLHRGYRRARIDTNPYLADLLEPANIVDTAPVLEALPAYFSAHGLGVDWRQMHELQAEELIDVLAMMCPFGAAEKQALLQAQTPRDRADLLTALLKLDSQTSPAPAFVQ